MTLEPKQRNLLSFITLLILLFGVFPGYSQQNGLVETTWEFGGVIDGMNVDGSFEDTIVVRLWVDDIEPIVFGQLPGTSTRTANHFFVGISSSKKMTCNFLTTKGGSKSVVGSIVDESTGIVYNVSPDATGTMYVSVLNTNRGVPSEMELEPIQTRDSPLEEATWTNSSLGEEVIDANATAYYMDPMDFPELEGHQLPPELEPGDEN